MIAQFDGFEIHPIQEGDASTIHDFIIANTGRFKMYFPVTVAQNLTPSLSQYFVQQKLKAFKAKEEFLFTLKQCEHQNIVGLIYIKDIDLGNKQGEFAYCIGSSFEGQGLTSKTVALLSQYAFNTLHLETLQIIVHKTNTASVKVATNNGYKWQKTLKNEFTPAGKAPINMELYELYKS